MGVRSRATFGVVSQGMTSATNFIIVILIARTQSPDQLGAWALGFAAITLATTLSRATISTPIVLTGAEDRPRDVGGGLAFALLAGVLSGVVVLSISFIGLLPINLALVMAGSAVVALGQDFLRYSWIARGVPRNALVLDSVWLVPQVAFSIVCVLAGIGSAAVLTATWGTAAALSLVVGLIMDRHARPTPTSVASFLATHRRDSSRLFGESLANALSANLQPFVVTAFVGLAAAGALRVAQTLFAPLTTLVAGLSPVILRELARRMKSSQSTLRIRLGWQIGLGSLNLVYGLVLIFLPASIGEALAGSSWADVTVLLVPLAVQSLIRPTLTISALTLRASRRFSFLRTSSWVFLAPSVLLPGIFGLFWGVPGVGWGLVVDIAARAIFYWVANARLARNPGTNEA